MIVGGTYIQRLWKKIIPFTGPMVLISSVFGVELLLLYIFIFFSLFMWALDSAVVYFKFKNPQPLKLENGIFNVDEIYFDPNEIAEIYTYDGSQGRLKYEILRITLKDGRKITTLDRPANLWNEGGRPSKAVKIIIEKFPFIESRVIESQLNN